MAQKETKATLSGLSFEEVRDLTAAGMPIAQVKELADSGFTAEQIMELAGVAPKTGGGGLSKEDIQEIIKAGNEGKYRQNVQHPGKSVFSHPEGDVKHKKPTLARVTFVNNHREDVDQLSPSEIDAYNSITRSCTARNGQWTATIKRNGTTEELHIILPTSLDGRPNEPIALVCRELAMGPAAVDALSLAQRVAELEAKLGATV